MKHPKQNHLFFCTDLFSVILVYRWPLWLFTPKKGLFPKCLFSTSGKYVQKTLITSVRVESWDRKLYQSHKFDKFTIKKFVPWKWLVHKEILRHFGTFTFSFRLFFVFFPVQILSFTGTQSAMGPRWPGHYFCQFEKRLPQPEIKSTRQIRLKIRFNPA